MCAVSLHVQIKSLEAQLSVLKAQAALDAEAKAKTKKFADLYGILSVISDSTEEEIKSAKYHFNWHNESHV